VVSGGIEQMDDVLTGKPFPCRYCLLDNFKKLFAILMGFYPLPRSSTFACLMSGLGRVYQ
jgi:hypothetical protein